MEAAEQCTKERAKSPCVYVTDEFHSAIFAWPYLLSDRTPLL